MGLKICLHFHGGDGVPRCGMSTVHHLILQPPTTAVSPLKLLNSTGNIVTVKYGKYGLRSGNEVTS